MNPYLIIIVLVLLGRYIFDLIVDRLNVKNVNDTLPSEFKGYYDAKKYKTSQNYLKDNTNFGNMEDSIQTAITLIFVLVGGFNFVDILARKAGAGSIGTGLIFAGILLLGSKLMSIPFAVYDTFVLEDKYGFNKTTRKTFILDIVKSLILAVIIGGLVLALILWIFGKLGTSAWIYCWVATMLLQIFFIFIAPYIIMPLFNKFIPLEDGELKTKIEDYAKAEDFKIQGVYKMDGSKRSAKSNAFFTGLGKSKRIVLFDTLIEKHTPDELLSIVAHEMGHYKKKHIIKAIIRSFATTALTFYLISIFLENKQLFAAFKMDNVSIYASLFFFGFLYAPLSMVISIIESSISRKHEYEADAYAVETIKKPEVMIEALKTLSVDNLSNLTPHPLKVFLSYSHPPVLKRIKAIRAINTSDI